MKASVDSSIIFLILLALVATLVMQKFELGPFEDKRVRTEKAIKEMVSTNTAPYKDKVSRNLFTKKTALEKAIRYIENQQIHYIYNICRSISAKENYLTVTINEYGCKVEEFLTDIFLAPTTPLSDYFRVADMAHIKDSMIFKQNLNKIIQYRNTIEHYENYIVKIDNIIAKREIALTLNRTNLSNIERESEMILRKIDKELTKNNILNDSARL